MKYTIANLRKDFPNDDRCLEYIFKKRFPDAKGFNREKNTKRYTHQKGHKHIYPLAGTIFEGSTTPLTLWFHAMYLFSISKNGVSAKELQRQLGVTYKTAWRMANQIRKLMVQGTDKLTGIIEIDESMVSKHPAVGLMKRGGSVRVKATVNRSGQNILPHIVRNVETDATLHSDNNPIYKWLDRHYKRSWIEHSRKQYARDNVYTNSIEAFWSQVKRSIAGTHHHISAKHLQSYLDFFAFQHEHRTSSIHPFWVLLGRACQ